MVESVIRIKSGITINVDTGVENIIYVKKNYIWNPTTCSCENGKYLANIIDDSVITCDEIIEDTKSIPTNFNEKTIICEAKNLYILLTFLLITIALLTAVGISLCIVKY